MGSWLKFFSEEYSKNTKKRTLTSLNNCKYYLMASSHYELINQKYIFFNLIEIQ